MSETRWTPEQEMAIRAGGSNILVAAAAGSGKTATLVERIIRRLTDPTAPLDVDQLLVVTFTEAAATEMRERIGAALQKALAAEPENARLQRQLALLGRASISTLHSFCLGLLRQYFYRLGLDPALSVMSDHEALLLRSEVLDGLFSQRYEEEPDGPFYALVERYGGGRDDEGLRQLIFELYEYVQSLPWPEQWLRESIARFELPEQTVIEDLPWWEPLRRQVGLQLRRASAALIEASRVCRLPGGSVAYADLLEREAAAVQMAAGAQGWEALCAAVQAIAFDRLPAVRKGTADETLQEQAKDLREQAKKAIKALMETYFARTADEWLADLRSVAPHLRTLAELVLDFAKAFRAAKAEASAVDFNDLERFALQLLSDPASPPGQVPSEVARELRRRYAEILVDEYQDINSVQDAILSLVARDAEDGQPNRFMVGDVKQSIYRFRHADPSLFLAKYQTYEPWHSGGALSTGGRIVLGANFRSRGGVVDGVNYLFRQIMTQAVGELPYDRDAELVCRADYPARFDSTDAETPVADPPVEVHLLEQAGAAAQVAVEDGDEPVSQAGDAAAQELSELSALEREARLVAWRIRALVDGTADAPPMQVWDRGLNSYRRLRYRDIVILLRATTGRANLFMEALAQVGIPAYAQLSTGYFSALEVEVMLSLLQILDNPRQDIPLAAVLHSPVVGLSAEELARIRVAAPGGSFYDALLAARRQPDQPELSGKLTQFLSNMEQWRTAARRRPLSQVIWLIYQQTGYLHYVSGMPGGTQRYANLLALYDRARQFDQFARQGLFRFLRFIERLREEEADMGTAPALGEGEDVVRLMSIHKSKGLEFPVVFVAGMGKAFARQDQQGDLLLQKHLGFGPCLVQPDQRVKYPTLAWHAVREAIRLDALAEELRVLYVALTRARERLILVGSAKEMVRQCECWAGAAHVQGWALPETLLASATSYLDWLGPALARHAQGEPLRRVGAVGAPVDAEVAADASRWSLRIWDLLALQAEVGSLTPQPEVPADPLNWTRIGALEPLDRPFDPSLARPLEERFAWEYPFAELVPRFAKLSVTELKGQFRPDVDPAAADTTRAQRGAHLERSPRFMQETRKSLTPTELGTLMHLVLQHLDLARPLDAADVAAQLAHMVAREVVDEVQAGAVDVQAIAHFFASPLGVRIRQSAGRVQRELSFTLAMPAAEVYSLSGPARDAGEHVIVQGMIDLLLEEEHGLVLVDYKTDKREPEEAARLYQSQIHHYRQAIERILGKPVVEAYLHFLTSGISVPM